MVFLNSDGSGHIVETTYMSAQAAAMMGGMMSGMGGDMGDDMGDAEVTMSGGPMMDEEEAKAKATELGEGVVYISMKEVSKPDGSKGAQVVYKFDDITELKLTPGADSSEGGMGMEDEPEEEKEPITFGFSKGKLTVNLPASDKSAAPAADAGGPEDDMAAAMMQSMLPMLKGMRMRMFIRLPAEIKRTNASYVDVSSKSGEKRYVTLMDFNFDKLLAADGGMQKFMQAQDNADFGATAKLMAGIPGIKMEPQPTVTIEF